MAGEDGFGILAQAARLEVGQGRGRDVGERGVWVVLLEAPHARERLFVVLLLHGELLLLRGLQAVAGNGVGCRTCPVLERKHQATQNLSAPRTITHQTALQTKTSRNRFRSFH